MPNVDQVKLQVWELAGEVNAALGTSRIQPHQQKKTERNISLTGLTKGERLLIKPGPAGDGYQIALSGINLVSRMESFMKQLTGRTCDGYNQPGHREPRWYVGEYEYAKVRKAAYFFAGVVQPTP